MSNVFSFLAKQAKIQRPKKNNFGGWANYISTFPIKVASQTIVYTIYGSLPNEWQEKLAENANLPKTTFSSYSIVYSFFDTIGKYLLIKGELHPLFNKATEQTSKLFYYLHLKGVSTFLPKAHNIISDKINDIDQIANEIPSNSFKALIILGGLEALFRAGYLIKKKKPIGVITALPIPWQSLDVFYKITRKGISSLESIVYNNKQYRNKTIEKVLEHSDLNLLIAWASIVQKGVEDKSNRKKEKAREKYIGNCKY